MGFTGSRVTSISSDGWADRAGVELYDEIVELGGVDFFSLNDREKIEKLKEPRPLVLKFKRPGRIMRADFVNNTSRKPLPGFPDTEISTRIVEFNNLRVAQAPPPISPALGGNTDATPVGIGVGGGGTGGHSTPGGGPFGWFSRCCAPRETIENEMTIGRH